jgi:hypothetical protein
MVISGNQSWVSRLIFHQHTVCTGNHCVHPEARGILQVFPSTISQPFLNHFWKPPLFVFFFSPYIWNLGVCNWASMPKYQMMYCNDERGNLVLYIETSFSSVIPGLLHVWFADDLCFKCFQMAQQWKQLAFAWPSFNRSSNQQQFLGFFYWSDLISAGVLLHSLPLGDLRLRWRSRSMERIKMGGTSKYTFSEKMMINHWVL